MFDKISIVVLVLVIATVFMCANMAKAGEPVLDGLISYWTFDEKDVDREILRDVVGPNDGTIAGDLEIVPGKVGEAGFFDDIDVNIDCGNDLSLTLKDGLTMEYWVNWNGKRYSPTVGKESSYKNMIKPSGSFIFNLATSAHAWPGVTMGYTFPQNEWHHVVTTYDGNQMLLYVDGEPQGKQEPAGGNIQASSSPFRIGVYGVPAYCAAPGVDCRVLSGSIDEVRLYDRGLDADEVVQNFESTGFLAVRPNKKLVETWGEVKALR